MELTDIVTVELTNEGARVLNNYIFNNTVYIEFKNPLAIEKILFYGGDKYKAPLWKLIKVFGKFEWTIGMTTPFINLQKAD